MPGKAFVPETGGGVVVAVAGALQLWTDCLGLVPVFLAVLTEIPQILTLPPSSFPHLLVTSVLVCANFPAVTKTVRCSPIAGTEKAQPSTDPLGSSFVFSAQVCDFLGLDDASSGPERSQGLTGFYFYF